MSRATPALLGRLDDVGRAEHVRARVLGPVVGILVRRGGVDDDVGLRPAPKASSTTLRVGDRAFDDRESLVLGRGCRGGRSRSCR